MPFIGDPIKYAALLNVSPTIIIQIEVENTRIEISIIPVAIFYKVSKSLSFTSACHIIYITQCCKHH